MNNEKIGAFDGGIFGCFNNSSCGGGPTKPTEPTTPVPLVSLTPVVDGVVTVNMENLSFIPPDVVLEKGTRVTWINKDVISHSAVDKGGKFDSGLLSKGGTFSYTFNDSGTYGYYCGIHPGMTGTVTVK